MVTLRYFLTFLVVQLSVCSAFSQGSHIPYNSEYFHRIDRLELKNARLSTHFHGVLKPYDRKDLAEFLGQLNTDSLSERDSSDLAYLKNEVWEWDSTRSEGKGFLKHFFKQPADFYSVKTNDFDIHVSPIFHFRTGSENYDGEKRRQFVNTRGVFLRGTLNKKLGFYSYFTENQTSSPFYVKQYSLQQGHFPYTGYTRIIKNDTTRFDLDYMQAFGEINFRPNNLISLKLGHNKNFVGSGVRSLILSDYSAPYFNFKANVKLGRLEYMNMLAKLADQQSDTIGYDLEVIPPKFMVFHHLNINVTKNLNIGLFETVLFGDRKFDMNYLNPVIFYRFVEGLLGSSDNAIVGADFRWLPGRGAMFYGQFVLDEFNTVDNKKGGSFNDKKAWQLGFKMVDFLDVEQLDIQVEFNSVRPYTFSHFKTFTNASNYNIPLGHPLGANFNEFIGILRWQPITKLFVKGTYLNYAKGFDTPNVNWGGDVLKNYRVGRPYDNGNFIAQGDKRKVHLFRADVSYMLYHNVFLDLNVQSRNIALENAVNKPSRVFNIGIRWNFMNDEYLF